MSTHAHRFRGLETRPAVHVPGSMSARLAAFGGAIFFGLVLREIDRLTDGGERR
jgi:hypothetical protein